MTEISLHLMAPLISSLFMLFVSVYESIIAQLHLRLSP